MIFSPQSNNCGSSTAFLRYNGLWMWRTIARWVPYWYAALAAGFSLLAVVHIIWKDAFWLIAIRLVLAAGFAVLSWMELHSRSRNKR